MATCKVCGNEYDQSFQLWLGGETQSFDSIECAFYAVAPRCACCDRQIIGRGIETAGIFFCCAHCARQYEPSGLESYQYTSEIIYALG